jgi:hypothetical protein
MNTYIGIDFPLQRGKATILPNSHSVHKASESLNESNDANATAMNA